MVNINEILKFTGKDLELSAVPVIWNTISIQFGLDFSHHNPKRLKSIKPLYDALSRIGQYHTKWTFIRLFKQVEYFMSVKKNACVPVNFIVALHYTGLMTQSAENIKTAIAFVNVEIKRYGLVMRNVAFDDFDYSS